jgi:hypothetical protein
MYAVFAQYVFLLENSCCYYLHDTLKLQELEHLGARFAE